MLKILAAIILLSLYVYLVIIFRQNRAWLTYYVVATFGLVLIIVLSLKFSGLEKYIEFLEMTIVRLVAVPIGTNAQPIGMTTVQVQDSVGPIALNMGIESSGLIESAVLVSLIGFYPAFSWQRKLRFLGIGLGVIVIANIFRVLIIVSMTHFLGRETIFLAHAVIGRLFFLACVIALFWYVITRPTVDEVSKIIRGVNVG